MCRRVTCRTCKLPTWAGCGAHVEQVLGDVPQDQRCQCRAGVRSAPATAPSPFKVTAKRAASASSTSSASDTTRSRLRRWLGR